MVAPDTMRALNALKIIEPLLSSKPTPETTLVQAIRNVGLPYNWRDGRVPQELATDLAYLHGINGLTETSNGEYTRGKLTDYWLSRV